MSYHYIDTAGPYDYDEAYYTDEIQPNSSPSPPERVAHPYYYPEDINEFDDADDVPYYDDDPIYSQDQPQYFPSAQYLPPAPPQPFQFPRRTAQYQPQFGQRPQNAFMAPSPPVRGSNPRNSSGIRLRPVSELPDIYRGIFKFGVFNAVQSTCFDTVFNNSENVVMSAPTGSGKTVIFELAIIRMLKQARETGQSVKCVYMAPTKALCAERQRDWSSKFDALGIKCCEMTGDTVHFGKDAWGDAKNATIIITTGEKWDSLTRNWSNHGQILSQIQLFLVDEVHILNESRGSTLEVVISRMKARGSSVRFVLVSATVPNIEDIAHWIANKRRDGAAAVFQFGEDFRPCKLTRHVVAVPRQRHDNDFAFAGKLNFKLFATLQTYSVGKPILVFVSTRKGVVTAAERLMEKYKEAEHTKQSLPWSHPKRVDQIFHEKKLAEFAPFGIGIHHAGLTMDDRRSVEDLFLKGILRVVIATSTLAVGVNLPAHTVVIRGVQTFQNNVSCEYSDLDIMQMLGRAGRPQFDKEGIAIIMCETELESKYRELSQGKTIVESSLHTNLSEHLNSEIGLGTISSVQSAKEWLRSSFLFQRIQKNPAHYALGKGENQSWQDRVDDMVMQSVDKLRQTQLITTLAPGDTSGALNSTDFGDIMSKFYIRQSTMGLILNLPERPSLRDILEMISNAEEFSDMKLRSSEKTVYNNLRKHNDIRFEVRKADKTSDKVFLLIQAVLGCIPLNSSEFKSSDSQPSLEAFSVFKHVSRIARVIVEVAIVRRRGAQLKYGLELVRCLTAKAWEDRPVVLRQIESIGEKSLKVLAENGITSLALLRKQEPYRIETLLNRRPPFGHEVLASANDLPQYRLSIKQVEVLSNGGKDPVQVDLSITCGLLGDVSSASKTKKGKFRSQMTAIITLTSDMEMIDFRRIPTKALKEDKTFEITAELTKPSQSVVVYITSESIAGVTVTETYKPAIPYKEYPTRVTRPPTTIDLDLKGLEDDPDFWKNMGVVDEHGDEIPEELPAVPVRDLTKPQGKKVQKPHSVKAAAGEDLHKPSPRPRKLPNGHYSCNHSCKDKTKCRHMCCRDGLPAPPKQSKKHAGPSEATNIMSPVSSPHPTKKTKQKRPDSTMENLEALNKRTNVSLKVPEGGRLKLDASKNPPRKPRPVLDFSVELTELDHKEPTVSYTVPDLKDDDDDLPEPRELLKAAKYTPKNRESSPETNYSDSELDSLIRQAPSNLGIAAPIDKGFHKPAPSTPLPSRKRSPSCEVISPPPKRSRFDHVFSSSPARRQDHNKIGTQYAGKSELFAGDSEMSDAGYADLESDTGFDDEDFTLDCEILPTTPALTVSDDSKATSDISTPRSVFKSPVVAPAPAGGKGMQDVEMEMVDEQDDDMKALDAWLNSGAVEIVYS
ncbi:Sec63 Brl domain-containing protein [Roridomyces roridus]|uniref:DNA 3'-5' helicase n=1 Tax=Roridomyces roridus TaxID=1738132 RepID=A0AAD7BX41_9AGAR|nr:Sec63 Brl domain-containing protein [Roridomyces roridus]